MRAMPKHNLTTSRAIVAIASLFLFAVPPTHAQSTRPDSEKQLAHDIYKEFIEIRSGFTTSVNVL